MEVPRLRVASELQLPAYNTATGMQDPSHIWDLHHSSWQHQIPNLLSKARDRTLILMDTSWILFCCAATNSLFTFFSFSFFFFFFFKDNTCGIWKFLGQGLNLSCMQLGPMPQPWQHWILYPLSTPGIKPTSSQRQCRVLNLLNHNGNSKKIIFKNRNSKTEIK